MSIRLSHRPIYGFEISGFQCRNRAISRFTISDFSLPEAGDLPPQLHKPDNLLRGSLTPNPPEKPVVSPTHCKAASDTLLLRIAQYSALAVPTADAALFDSSHRQIERVVNHQRGIDRHGAGFHLLCDVHRGSVAAGPN